MSEMVDRLMDAAESGIRLRGYHAVSFRDLADELGIKSSSVHYYFRQKEDLGIALVKRYGARFFAALEAATAGATGPDDRLRAYCRLYRKALIGSKEICLCGMLGAESRGLPKPVADAVAAFFKANIAWVEASLPKPLAPRDRQAKAAHIVAALQGAMVLSGSLDQPKIFDNTVRDLLA